MCWRDLNYWKQFNIKSEHYLIRYINFINSIQNKSKRNLEYIERHHIVPKCYIYNNCIIELTPREHFIAHHILMRALGGKMVFAFHRMCYSKNCSKNNRYYIISSRVYEELRNKSRILLLYGENNPFYGRKHSDNTKKLISNRLSNPSKETRRKMSESAKCRDLYGEKNPFYKKHHTEEFKKSASERMKGTVKYHKGNIEIYINISEEKKYIEDGWTKGEKDSHRRSKSESKRGSNNCMYGKMWVNKDGIDKVINKDNKELYLQDGWSLGRKKMTIEQRNKISLSKRKKVDICEI